MLLPKPRENPQSRAPHQRCERTILNGAPNSLPHCTLVSTATRCVVSTPVTALFSLLYSLIPSSLFFYRERWLEIRERSVSRRDGARRRNGADWLPFGVRTAAFGFLGRMEATVAPRHLAEGCAVPAEWVAAICVSVIACSGFLISLSPSFMSGGILCRVCRVWIGCRAAYCSAYCHVRLVGAFLI